ncbi:MAG: shikimate kinase [Pseudomonadota bacterium]
MTISLSQSEPSEPDRHGHSNVILIGPMGSGKTTLGRRLAPLLNRRFIDLDDELERRCGVEVAVVFEIEGEAGFRKRESALLAELVQQRDLVLATGGGSVLDEGNRRLMQANGLIVWLNTSVAQQLRRLERDRRRPLLAASDREQRLMAMAEERNPIYRSMAKVEFISKNLPLPRMAHALHNTVRDYLEDD